MRGVWGILDRAVTNTWILPTTNFRIREVYKLADRLRRSGLGDFGFDRKRTADDRSQQLLPLWMVEEG
jgi:hypothetical protein